MIRLLIAFILISTAAFAQQPQADAEQLKKIINSLQSQRNLAMDSAAMSDTRIATLSEELAKAQARIKELEPKTAEAPAEPKK